MAKPRKYNPELESSSNTDKFTYIDGDVKFKKPKQTAVDRLLSGVETATEKKIGKEEDNKK